MKFTRILLFDSTRFAIRAERILKKAQIQIAIIPTPRKYSTNCGVSIAFMPEDEEKVISTLKEKAVPFSGPFDV